MPCIEYAIYDSQSIRALVGIDLGRESEPDATTLLKFRQLLAANGCVNAASGLVHSVVGTAGNVADVTQAHELQHGDKIVVLGDAGYQGVEKRAENISKLVIWHVAMKRSKRKALPKNKVRRLTEKLEHLKASMHAKVECPFHVVKNLFGHRKTRYRGLAKNTAKLFTLFAFANLVLAGRRFTITESCYAS